MKTFLKTLLIWGFLYQLATAQTQPSPTSDWRKDRKVSLLFGLIQPIAASGFNVEGNLIYNRFIFDYSHGTSLDFGLNSVSSELKRQGVVVHMPWTTGFGVGYRIREWVNLRVEPKWHRFEYRYEGDAENQSTQITSNNTFTLGLGLYFNYRPFKKQNNFLKGLTLAPSVRFWPTVNSTFMDDKFTYKNRNTDKMEEIKTQDPGVNLTPLVLNVSVGYTFDLRKKK